jgi:hypothetical protein
MNKLAILQSARIAELKAVASSTARLCMAPAAVELSRRTRRDGNSGRRLLLLLLARERRRNAGLVKLLEE